MPRYRITDPATGQTWITESATPPTQQDLDELIGETTPPRSAGDPTGQIQSVDLRPGIATMLRVGGGLLGAVGGELIAGPPGAVAGGALGSGLAEAAAEKVQGRDLSPVEITTETVLGGAAPLANTTVRAAVYGLGSVTLDAIARHEGVPTVGQMALGTIFAAGLHKGLDKLTLRSSLREVLPQDVSKEVHPILTTGKFVEEPRSISLREELAEFKEAKKQLSFPFKPQPAPEVDLSEVSNVEPRLYEKRGPKGRFEKLTSAYKEQPLPGFTEAPKERPLPGHYPRIAAGLGGDIEPVARTHPAGIVKGRTAASVMFGRPARLFDELQKQTGLPVYDEVYLPLRDAMNDPDALRTVVKEIQGRYGRGKLDVLQGLSRESAEVVYRAVEGITKIAQTGQDGTARDLAYALSEYASRLGKNLDPETATRWAYHMITVPQISLLPFRVGPTLRVFSHTLQTGYYLLGEKWLAKGLARALTADGMREAVQLGALEAEAVPEEVLQVGKGKGWYDRLVRYGFMGFRYAQDKSRAILFHGQYLRTLSAAKRAGSDVMKFVDLANLDFGLPQAEAVNIAKMFHDGRVKEAAVRAGIARADFGIPTHSRLDRPMVMSSSTLGRTVFGLYNWPSFYGSVIKNSWLPKALGGTGEGSVPKKGIAFARWVAANYLLYHIARNLYGSSKTKSAEDKARELTFFGPTLYEGGPAIGTTQGVITGTKKFVSGEKGGFKQFMRAAKPLVPFEFAAEDLWAAGVKLKKTIEDRQ